MFPFCSHCGTTLPACPGFRRSSSRREILGDIARLAVGAGSIALAISGCGYRLLPETPAERVASWDASRYAQPREPGWQTDQERAVEEEARRQRLSADLERRIAEQGSAARKLNDRQCERFIHGLPSEGAPMGKLWSPGQPSEDNPYYTPQENYCLALSRSHVSPAEAPVYPGMLPVGWHATYLGNGYWQLTPD
jgi:hypothetical protein